MIYKAYPRITLGLKTFGMKNANKLLFDSIFVLVDQIYDEISIEEHNHLEVTYLNSDNNFFHVLPKDDLIIKSLNLLERNYGIKANFKIVVRKNINFGSGLSAYAACAAVIIKHIANMFNLPLNFFTLASELNQAIPFFLTNFKVARVQSFGDQVVGIGNLVIPPIKIHLQTDLVDPKKLINNYQKLDLKLASNYISVLLDDLASQKAFKVFNELQPAIFETQPNLLLAYAKIKTNFNEVFISGKGNTLIEINDPFFNKK